MKFSTILIVVGIAIVIIGGIVFMNNIQSGSKNSLTPTNSATQKAHNLFAETVNSKPVNKPLNNPMTIIFIGALLAAIGIYDHYRTKNFPG